MLKDINIDSYLDEDSEDPVATQAKHHIFGCSVSPRLIAWDSIEHQKRLYTVYGSNKVTGCYAEIGWEDSPEAAIARWNDRSDEFEERYNKAKMLLDKLKKHRDKFTDDEWSELCAELENTADAHFCRYCGVKLVDKDPEGSWVCSEHNKLSSTEVFTITMED